MKREFFVENRKKLGQILPDRSLLILFAGEAPQKSADQVYEFVVNRNFYYVTGSEKPKQVLLLARWGEQVEETLFIEKADPVLEKWIGKRMTVEEAREATGVRDVKFVEELGSEVRFHMMRHQVQVVYLDLERQAWEGGLSQSQRFAHELREKYPYVQVRDAFHEISRLRRTKTPDEVEKIRRAIEVTDRGIRNMMKHARPGMFEYQLEAHFDYSLRMEGVRTHAFRSIVAGGKNATILHYEENNCRVNDGDLVLIDLGAQVEHYNADISRTFPVNGTFSERQRVLYEIVLKALTETTKIVKPGLPFEELNATTKRILTEECKKIGLIEDEAELGKYYFHKVSHYLGLDTHDVGGYRDVVLEPGMVLTIEPGLYVEEEGIGIRIEDDVLVTEDGHEVLSAGILRTVEEIEAFMRGEV
jgi:Xaa-Pro aminopeptidase